MNMAEKKKKKKSYRRRSYKKKGRSGRKAKPAGLAGGLAYAGGHLVFVTPDGASGSMFDAAKAMDLDLALRRVPYALKDKDVWMGALGGMLISASPRIPVIGIVARPVDRGLKRLTKGKWGL